MKMNNLGAYLTSLALCAACATTAAQTADVVYVNGKIYTVDQAQPWAEALAVNNGVFEVVGSNKAALAAAGKSTKVVDLNGAFLMPGLMDVHNHPLTTGIDWSNLSIENPDDADAIIAQLKAFAEANPDLPVIRGGSWNLGVFDGDSPPKELLDAVVSDRPVYLISQTGHSAWVNSKALEMAGINKETPQTDTFIFDTDPETGEPSGTVREFGMGAVVQALPPLDPEPIANAQARIYAEFNSFGFTSIKPAEGDAVVIEASNILDRRGDLTLRLFPSWDWRSHYMPVSLDKQRKAIANWKSYETDMVKPSAVKMFFDGGPDSYTAYLLEDYVGRPGYRGQPNRPLEEVEKEIIGFNQDGLGVIVHVLGDAGGRELVNVFSRVRQQVGPEGPLLHFSHAWMTRPVDFKPLAETEGVCVDFSPALSYPHPAIEGSMAPPIGERYQSFFNVRAAFEAFGAANDEGAPIGFGSDWPSALIPDPDGFHQIQSWITRIDPDNPASGALNPKQAISLEQALYGFTQGSAHCLGRGWEDKVGSITPGKYADFIVLDRNPFDVPISNLHKTKVTRTVVGGDVVYDRDFDLVDDILDEESSVPSSRYADE
jgi:predicted amidohydrolase YtcJ